MSASNDCSGRLLIIGAVMWLIAAAVWHHAQPGSPVRMFALYWAFVSSGFMLGVAVMVYRQAK